ncbi:similar to Saccharomyces cerevisiae YOR194C TOA1 TFIIA large subunit [Maudiozyma barnettii]|uniref:Transcription initiation factor IIA large subunit n=1 Tax=Maudiozyma barnettii TaxID=61262 RepID=A0A8H2VCH8_9SACH|nr:transcription initiation factor IIA large subunit [Kazachstania barnettii]CAB4252751.1 similar to Saccharomyces cerevisiae YOR194C TOA1 TFIIA large subunit [Kazachstania barnettii]CAD1780541.1 similar to Saccharomyces cerevisiae YOR194C TOA1 TFIIA large subunit [Kazachstania barnettii]
MSNTEASRTYEAIVEAVINEVREDFENAGIDEQTLQDLKRNWQIKLSETKVTQFTWDSAYNDGDTVNQSVAAPTETSTAATPLTLTNNNSNNNEGITSAEGVSQDDNNNNNISTADATDAPTTTTTTVKSENGNEQELMPLFEGNNSQPEIKEENESNGTEKTLPTPQTDISNSNNNKEQDDTNNIESPDKETEETNKSTEIELEIDDPNGSAADQVRLQAKKAKRSALLDTDEVGSELDDSDDDYLISEGEDDGPDENLMLCLYDKVTRTKARWKCSLKDGVVTINHKDYTFQKAQVEAEWV